MSATVKGATLTFGCTASSGVIMQNFTKDETVDVYYAQDEQAAYTAYAIPSNGKVEASGDYLWKGSDVAAIAAALPGHSYLYITSIGVKESNTGFKMGQFKASGINNIT